MYKNEGLLIGKNDKKEVYLLPSMANRHGLITGASGTGKTITSKVMAESLSDLGVPVFMADVKGDLSGTATCDEGITENIQKRVDKLKLDGFEPKAFPVAFWDVYKQKGNPIRFKVSEIGPSILSIMLGLSEVQEGVLNIIFKAAEKDNYELDNLDDLKHMLNHVSNNKKDYSELGNVTTQSVGVIIRSLSVLENQGLDNFFGTPEFKIDYLLRHKDEKGVINILDAVELYKNPDLYSAVMLCLLTKLYDYMPEVGDLDKPKIVFFFDEAYFLFREMPSYRLKQVEKIVRLIRSKGIGLYFISHYTTDIPATVLDQLGNRVQHNLRAYTPADQKIAKAAADSFRTNPEFKTYDTILELGTGEAIVSFQNEKGEPEVCERVFILPPQSKIGVIDDSTRLRIMNNYSFDDVAYLDGEDRTSAHEKLKEKELEEENKKAEEQRIKDEEKAQKEAEKEAEKERKQKEREAREAERKKKNSVPRKVGRRVASRVEGRLITRALNAIEKMFKK